MESEAWLLNSVAYFINQLQDLERYNDIKEWRVHPDSNSEAGTFTLWITFNNGKTKEYRTSRFFDFMEIHKLILMDVLKEEC